MDFREKLKKKRTGAGLVQPAGPAGAASRTIQDYEPGSRRPVHIETV